MTRKYKINNVKRIGRWEIGRTSQMTYILRDSHGEFPDLESSNKAYLIKLAENRIANNRLSSLNLG